MSRPYDSSDESNGSSDSSADSREDPSRKHWIGATALAAAGAGLLDALITEGIWWRSSLDPNAGKMFGSGMLYAFGVFVILLLAAIHLALALVFGTCGIFLTRERGRRLGIYALVLAGPVIAYLCVRYPLDFFSPR